MQNRRSARYNTDMSPTERTAPSASAIIAARIDQLETAMAEKDTPLRRELIALIESDRHLLIGAQALIQYTEPRFTADTDYAVGLRSFQRIRKWFKAHEEQVTYQDEGEAIRSESLAVDVLNAAMNPVLLEVLKAENALASPEALAACKYVAIASPARGRERRLRDAADFAALVLREGFEDGKLLGYMVGPYATEHDTMRALIRDIRDDKPMRI